MKNNRILLLAVLLLTASTQTYSKAVKGSDSELSKIYAEIPFKMNKVVRPVFPKRQVSIVEFGAVNDGRTLNTAAFAKAIQTVSEKGGGTVLVPEGLWLTGPIEFKNNVCLHTVRGAIVVFTRDFSSYPMVKTFYEGLEGWRTMSPLYARNASNIAITGEGIFDGNGDAWRPVKKTNVTMFQWRDFVASGGILNADQTVWYPSKSALDGSMNTIMPKNRSIEEAQAIKDFLRPVLLNFIQCKTILIDGPTFRNSPAWCLHPLMCENLTIRGVSVENESWASNGDALDVESCKNVVIMDCSFDAGDDGICMKSGKDAEGRKRGIPTENVIVSNCRVYKGHGGFVVGSEMSGGVRNVFLKDCQFIGTDNGLRFKSTRGRGGVVENIYIENVDMVNIKSDAILYDLYYGGKKTSMDSLMTVTDLTPSFKNIHMKNIVCKGAKRAAVFQGLPEMKLSDISLENAVLEADSGIQCSDVEHIYLTNVSVFVKGEQPIHVKKRTNIAYGARP